MLTRARGAGRARIGRPARTRSQTRRGPRTSRPCSSPSTIHRNSACFTSSAARRRCSRICCPSTCQTCRLARRVLQYTYRASRSIAWPASLPSPARTGTTLMRDMRSACTRCSPRRCTWPSRLATFSPPPTPDLQPRRASCKWRFALPRDLPSREACSPSHGRTVPWRLRACDDIRSITPRAACNTRRRRHRHCSRHTRLAPNPARRRL